MTNHRCVPLTIALALGLSGCISDGHLNLLGYTAKPPDALPFPTPSLPSPNAIPGTVPPIITATPADGIPVLTSPVDPDAPPVVKPKVPPVIISSTGNYVPELGQSTTTSLQGNID